MLAAAFLSVAATGSAVPSGTTAPTVATAPVSAPSLEGPGPALLTPRSARLKSLTCYGDLERAELDPVLLVPGTAVTAGENWDPTYRPELRDRGHSVCTVDLPHFATRDVQASSEYVATAIRALANRTSRTLSVIGHSQGALLAQVALRTWPDLSAHVDDVIGLAGVYDRGSAELARRCQIRCTTVLHQLAAGSAFLARISRRPLPSGPSYTNIGTLGDLTVTPQPAANRQRGATSFMVQDVCHSRGIPLSEHAMIVGDNAALALTVDALDHSGPARLGRIDPEVCDTGDYPGFDSLSYLAVATLTQARASKWTEKEPALYCRYRPQCRNPVLRGPLIASPRYDVGRQTVTIRTRAFGRGKIVVLMAGRRVSRQVEAGPLVLHIHRPRARARLRIFTEPQYYTRKGLEARRWVAARR